MIGRRLSDFALVYSGGHPGIFLRNGTVFRGPRTEWLQLEPVDSALALTGPAGLKVADHIFHAYTGQQRKLRSSVGGQEHMEHIEHVFSYIIPGLAPRGRSVLALSPVFFTKVCVPCVLCVLTDKIRKRGVFRYVFQCVHRRKGWYHFVPFLRHLRLFPSDFGSVL